MVPKKLILEVVFSVSVYMHSYMCKHICTHVHLNTPKHAQDKANMQFTSLDTHLLPTCSTAGDMHRSLLKKQLSY